MSAQRARQPPFVREAATSLSGLSLRLQCLHPKRRLSGARFVTQADRKKNVCLDKSAADIPGTYSLLVLPLFLRARGCRHCNRNPTGTEPPEADTISGFCVDEGRVLDI